ncbi:MAG: methyltransferase domain-containing protein [Rhodobacterales bacterium]|nr:methyltransferase domain-containing protein [Rhodobacterales bacterium]
MTNGFLDKAYNLEGNAATRTLYDAWSASYETEVAEHGYATPGRIARALHAHIPDTDTPILDFGCGTGLSGLALKLAGFQTIDGVDISAEMLAIACAKNLYRSLQQIDPDKETPFTTGDYHIITAIGVIGAGAAPAPVFDTLMDLLPSGGYFAFSFNDHTLQDPQFEAKVNGYLEAGTARLLFQEYGDHLPGINMKSSIYIVVKS